jgi:hypothetical protein
MPRQNRVTPLGNLLATADRRAPRHVQEEAARCGIIPFVPESFPPCTSASEGDEGQSR